MTMTGSRSIPARPKPSDASAAEYFNHSSAKRVNTDVVLVESLRRQYPELTLTIVPRVYEGADLLSYAASGHASAVPIDSENDKVHSALEWKVYFPPARRLDGGPGIVGNVVQFGRYMYYWQGHEYIVYISSGRDGTQPFPVALQQYILHPEQQKSDDLVLAASQWGSVLHNEVWVFDRGYWQKSAELWNSVQNSTWDDVILDPGMKKAIISDVEGFFEARETYARLKVPWKRGIIYYGPPGNGKTVSIKAMMHALYRRKDEVPTLYVRSLVSFAGPEAALSDIFGKARAEAPCYLVFEDLDTIINDNVRSYFLNEVDGLKSNDGILMVGSTNHIDRLDPGISKRPSRFDRKYFFPDPPFNQRVAYCKFWQKKLADTPDVAFPDILVPAIARRTSDFSFAYMQEAFIATLLAIARLKTVVNPEVQERDWGRKEWDVAEDWYSAAEKAAAAGSLPIYPDVKFFEDGGKDDDDDPSLDQYILWREIKKTIKILREEMSGKQAGPPRNIWWEERYQAGTDLAQAKGAPLVGPPGIPTVTAATPPSAHPRLPPPVPPRKKKPSTEWTSVRTGLLVSPVTDREQMNMAMREK